MKKIITIALLIVMISSCCKNQVRATYKVIEKIHTQERDGLYINYILLLENGSEVDVTSKEYAKAKIGDEYCVNECVN